MRLKPLPSTQLFKAAAAALKATGKYCKNTQTQNFLEILQKFYQICVGAGQKKKESGTIFGRGRKGKVSTSIRLSKREAMPCFGKYGPSLGCVFRIQCMSGECQVSREVRVLRSLSQGVPLDVEAKSK